MMPWWCWVLCYVAGVVFTIAVAVMVAGPEQVEQDPGEFYIMGLAWPIVWFVMIAISPAWVIRAIAQRMRKRGH